MTEKRCTDCKYTRGIGYDFWCGEGHTEYEVFGAETSCPYYKYHDWSKGTPTTKKRFREVASIKTIKDNQTGIAYTYCLVDDDFLDLINTIADENEQLKKKIKKILQKKYNQSKKDYERAVKAGMPSSISYDEMEIYEELAKEMGVDLE